MPQSSYTDSATMIYASLIAAPQTRLDGVPSAIVIRFIEKTEKYLEHAIEHDPQHIPALLAELGFWYDQWERYEPRCGNCGRVMEQDDGGSWCSWCLGSILDQD